MNSLMEVNNINRKIESRSNRMIQIPWRLYYQNALWIHDILQFARCPRQQRAPWRPASERKRIWISAQQSCKPNNILEDQTHEWESKSEFHQNWQMNSSATKVVMLFIQTDSGFGHVMVNLFSLQSPVVKVKVGNIMWWSTPTESCGMQVKGRQYSEVVVEWHPTALHVTWITHCSHHCNFKWEVGSQIVKNSMTYFMDSFIFILIIIISEFQRIYF